MKLDFTQCYNIIVIDSASIVTLYCMLVLASIFLRGEGWGVDLGITLFFHHTCVYILDKSKSPVSVVEQHKILLFFLIAFVFSSERTPKRVPFSYTATQAWCSCLWEEHGVRWWGRETPRLALEVRLGFIFLGRLLSKNILRSVLSVRQVLTRLSLLAAWGEVLWDGLLLSFSWFGGIHLHLQFRHSGHTLMHGLPIRLGVDISWGPQWTTQGTVEKSVIHRVNYELHQWPVCTATTCSNLFLFLWHSHHLHFHNRSVNYQVTK